MLLYFNMIISVKTLFPNKIPSQFVSDRNFEGTHYIQPSTLAGLHLLALCDHW